MVPTSALLTGLSNRSITSTLPVSSPGVITELPENTLTSTSCPLYVDIPTSSLGSTGSPTKILVGDERGWNRTSLDQVEELMVRLDDTTEERDVETSLDNGIQ